MQKIKCEIDYYVNHWPGPFRGRWGDSLFYAEENKNVKFVYYVNHWPGPFRGRWGDKFICRIEVLELKSNLTIIVLLAETKEINLS